MRLNFEIVVILYLWFRDSFLLTLLHRVHFLIFGPQMALETFHLLQALLLGLRDLHDKLADFFGVKRSETAIALVPGNPDHIVE